jgi:hypothetical protein
VENYFNYFTEIEECFRRCRGTPTLLSTLDWALVESWKEGGIPLAAVLAGIEHSFQKFSRRPQRFRKINGLAYCSQAVLEAAQQVTAAGIEGGAPGNDRAAAAPFTADEISNYLQGNARALEQAAQQARENRQAVLADDLAAAAAALEEFTGSEPEKAGADFEELERRLSAFEEKLAASLIRAASVELLARFRREVEQGLARCRQKMTAAQIESLERQFLKKRLFELYQIPRLSLFYL